MKKGAIRHAHPYYVIYRKLHAPPPTPHEVEPQRAKPKTYRQAPTHWLKFYEEAVIESEARTAVVQLKSEA